MQKMCMRWYFGCFFQESENFEKYFVKIFYVNNENNFLENPADPVLLPHFPHCTSFVVLILCVVSANGLIGTSAAKLPVGLDL